MAVTWAVRGAMVSVLAVLTAVVAAAPAGTHPFGPPLTANLSADGTTVTIHWAAAEDDWVTLGRYVGAFDPAAGGVVADAGEHVPVTGFELLARSADLRAYLLERITVAQAGAPCAGSVGELENVDDLLSDGMPLTFRCADDVDVVDIGITALTDLHEAYRTVAIADAAPGRALYTHAEGMHRWDFSARSAAPRFGGWAVALVAGLAALAVAALAFLRSRTGIREVS